MLYIYISYVIPACILIPIIIGCINYKHFSNPVRVMFWFMVCTSIGSLFDIVLSAHGKSTVLLFNITTIFEFAFLSSFYRLLFKKWRNTILVLIAGFSILCIVDFFFIQTGDVINTYTSTLEAFMIVGYGILYLNQQSKIDHEHSWANNGINWISIAILIYYSSGICMFVFANYLAKASVSVNIVIWSVFDTILLFQYILIAIGFMYAKRNR
jgi:hypothetical protein